MKKNVLGRVQMETIGGSRLLLNFKDEPNLKKCKVSSGSVAQYIRDRDRSRHRAHSTELLANFLGVSSKLHSVDERDKPLQRWHSFDSSLS